MVLCVRVSGPFFLFAIRLFQLQLLRFLPSVRFLPSRRFPPFFFYSSGEFAPNSSRSRGAGPGGLEGAAVRDSLAPADLERIHALGVDVLTVSFEALSRTPAAVLGAIADVAGAPPFPAPPAPAGSSSA